MKRILICIIILIPHFGRADTLVLAIPSTLYGVKMESKVFLPDLNKSPQWPDPRSNPPLAPGIAVQKALLYAGDLKHKDETHARVGDVTLKEVGSSYYIYVIQIGFYPEGARDGFVSPLYVVVLMDGTVVKLSEVPNSPNK
ncbi:MAG TPA: hypothetical protein VN048_06865 [Verrucomicrobiae bacterium]|jgi:hypothetical protein|nr:hypothetical protein [Verrucomicrobiae bacterium]